jgi:hypothetical protein
LLSSEGSDENDQFVGSTPTPSNCNGISIACTYSQFGEIDVNVQGLLAAQGIITPFDLHEDSAPAFYLHGQPAPTDSSVRTFERTTAGLQASNPYTGGTEKVSQYLADPTELKLLHMVTADPARTPTFAMFANPLDWVVERGADCDGSCSSIDPPEGWNHGDVQPQITNTWAALVGPGVANLGATGSIWSDHTDVQPTLMALLGLKDDYVPEGLVLSELMRPSDQSPATRRSDYRELARAYKQIEASVGLLGTYTLRESTRALGSDSSGDQAYRWIESPLAELTRRRDILAAQMIALLDGAAFRGEKIDQDQARRLEEKAAALTTPPGTSGAAYPHQPPVDTAATGPLALALAARVHHRAGRAPRAARPDLTPGPPPTTTTRPHRQPGPHTPARKRTTLSRGNARNRHDHTRTRETTPTRTVTNAMPAPTTQASTAAPSSTKWSYLRELSRSAAATVGCRGTDRRRKLSPRRSHGLTVAVDALADQSRNARPEGHRIAAFSLVRVVTTTLRHVGRGGALLLLTLLAFGCGQGTKPRASTRGSARSAAVRSLYASLQSDPILGRLGLAPVATRSPLPGDLMIADRDNNRVIVVSPAERIVWRFPASGQFRDGRRVHATR